MRRAFLTILAMPLTGLFPKTETVISLNMPPLEPVFVVSQFLWAGSPLIVIGNHTNETGTFFPQAVYALDSYNRPLQISGQHDLLVDGMDIEDITANYYAPLLFGKRIILRILESMSIENLVLHEQQLKSWANMLFYIILSNQLDWKNSVDLALEFWSVATRIPQDCRKIGRKAISSLKTAAPPMAEPLDVNLDRYPFVNIRRMGSV